MMSAVKGAVFFFVGPPFVLVVMLCALGQVGYGQSSHTYVVLNNGTRLNGEDLRWLWGSVQGGRVWLFNGANEERIEFQDIDYFVDEGQLVRIVKFGRSNKNRAYNVAYQIVQGPIQLYDAQPNDIEYDWFASFKGYEGDLRQKQFKHILVPFLSQCDKFQQQFGTKKLRYRHILRYVTYYNLWCG